MQPSQTLLTQAILDLVGSCKDPCACPADFSGDGQVKTVDLLELLANWGPCAECCACPWDLDSDCTVATTDLLELLAAWGPCPCQVGAGGGLPEVPLDQALDAIGFDSLVHYEIWLWGATDGQAFASAWALLAALQGQ